MRRSLHQGIKFSQPLRPSIEVAYSFVRCGDASTTKLVRCRLGRVASVLDALLEMLDSLERAEGK